MKISYRCGTILTLFKIRVKTKKKKKEKSAARGDTIRNISINYNDKLLLVLFYLEICTTSHEYTRPFYVRRLGVGSKRTD